MDTMYDWHIKYDGGNYRIIFLDTGIVSWVSVTGQQNLTSQSI